MTVLKAYKFQMYPTKEQKRFFIQNFGCVRFTYNHLLNDRQQQYYQTGFVRSRLTPASLKKNYPFLKEADSLALANTQLNLERAFRNYFRGMTGFPRLKTKKSLWQSYTTNNQQGTIQVKNHYFLKLPKLKTLVKIDGHRIVEGRIKSATISARKNEQFYVSLLCEEEIGLFPKTSQMVGVAFCPKHGILSSKELPNRPITRSHETTEKILKTKRQIRGKVISARRRKVRLADANNYQRHKRKLAGLYQHQRWQKKDYLEKISYLFLRQFDVLFVEMHPSFSLTEWFYEEDWREFLQILQYEAEWYGKQVFFVDVSRLAPKNPLDRSYQIEEIGQTFYKNQL